MRPNTLHIGLELWSDPTWIPMAPDGKLGTVAPTALPMSAGLIRDLMAWAKEYDDVIGPVINATGRSPPDDSPEVIRLHKRGLDLWRSVVGELGDRWEVHYDSPLEGESFRVHRPPANEKS